jgi:biopolymer transport protein ExbD
MRNWPSRRRSTARIEIIPMIDVMMFLLVFFVLISTNVLPALGLRVALPKAGDPDHMQMTRRVTLTISAPGKLYLDGNPVDPGALPDRLRALRSAYARLVVIIAADKAANLQALVGVLDALKVADVQAASIVTDPADK